MGPGVIVAIVVVVIAIVFVASRNNKSGKQSRANQDFMKSMDEKAKQRNILATNARTKDDDYGFSPDNPIMESTVHSSYQFHRLHIPSLPCLKIVFKNKHGFAWVLYCIEI